MLLVLIFWLRVAIILRMSTLDSSSSRDDVLNAIADNASYEEDSSVAKAKSYLTALLIWKNRWAFDESFLGPSKMRFDQINRTLVDDIAQVRSWIAAQPSTNPARAYSGYSLGSIEDNGRTR